MTGALILAIGFALVFLVFWLAERGDRKDADRLRRLYAAQVDKDAAELRRLRNLVAELKAECACLQEERDDERMAILKIVGPKGQT